MQLFYQPHPKRRVAKSGGGTVSGSLLSGTSTEYVPRTLRECFASTAIVAQNSSLNSLGLGGVCPLAYQPEYRANFTIPTCLEEAASANTKATSALVPSGLGGPISGPGGDQLRHKQRQRICTLAVGVTRNRLVCLLSNGVVESLKFKSTKAAKQGLAQETREAQARRALAYLEQVKAERERQGKRQGHGQLDLPPAPAGANEEPIISFDEEFIPSVTGPWDDHRFSLAVPLVGLDLDQEHFDILPRISLPNHATAQAGAACTCFTPSGHFLLTGGRADGSLSVTQLNPSSGKIVSQGQFSGHRAPVLAASAATIRDTSSSFGGLGQNQATEGYTSSTSNLTEVVASVDASGLLLIWTVSLLGRSGRGTNTYTNNISSKLGRGVISRRPQRAFTVRRESKDKDKGQNQDKDKDRDRDYKDDQEDKEEEGCSITCDLSWQMGVCAVGLGDSLRVFSIERDELLRAFAVDGMKALQMAQKNSPHAFDDAFDDIKATSPPPAPEPERKEGDILLLDTEKEGEEGEEGEEGKNSTGKKEKEGDAGEEAVTFVRKMVLCGDGSIIAQLCVKVKTHTHHINTRTRTRTHYLLATYTLAGTLVSSTVCLSPPTTLSCPALADVIITGHLDGSVFLWETGTLRVLYAFRPHLSCLQAEGGGASMGDQTSVGTVSSGYTEGNGSNNSNNSNNGSPVVSVTVGPDVRRPVVIVVSTEAGRVYVKPLMDFVSWEQVRSPTTFTKVVNVRDI